MTKITIESGKLKAIYDSETKTVTHFTRKGVMMECEVPKNWALTRVFQFMDSLILNSENLR